MNETRQMAVGRLRGFGLVGRRVRVTNPCELNKHVRAADVEVVYTTTDPTGRLLLYAEWKGRICRLGYDEVELLAFEED